MEEDM